MSFCDNRGTFNTDGFRLVCETALEKYGDELAGFVWADALAEYRAGKVRERMAAPRVFQGRQWWRKAS